MISSLRVSRRRFVQSAPASIPRKKRLGIASPAVTIEAALPHFPKNAVEHGKKWRLNKDESWTWDGSYTISENLFLAYQRGAGERYRELGRQYLYDEYYDPLAEGHDVLAGRHAYSYVNSLSSAMQAYLTLGSEKHLRAARNAFEMLSHQSFATGGWWPDEMLRAPESPDVAVSLTESHSSFETPCGSYAHFKLTRYLLRVSHDSRYGDCMERVMYNTVLGAKPLQDLAVARDLKRLGASVMLIRGSGQRYCGYL